MPPYSTGDADVAALRDMRALLESTDEFIEQDMLDIGAQYSGEAIDRLSVTTKPRGNDKYTWSNNKAANARARAWWFDKVKRGLIPTDGNHYIRQGKLSKGWDTDISYTDSSIVFAIFNAWPGAKYVYGKLTGAAYIGAYDTRNPTHKTDGWPLAYDIVNDIFNRMIDELIERYIQRMETASKSPKLTRRR